MIDGLGSIGALDFGLKMDGLSGLPKIPAGGAAATGGASFMDALSQVAGNAIEGLGRAETLSVQALTGDAPMRDVVDAVMSAEQSLQAAIAIRDKIVTAYLDLSRMAI